ncbi:MAG: DUF5069 domain-containing protein [Chthoniobacterales bacterium]
MSALPIRSPFAKVHGIFHFGRMLDKIKVHAHGQLPNEYVPNLGRGFDGRCVAFLKIAYPTLVERVGEEGSDEEILQWCFAQGRKPAEDEIHVWNEFMRKCGWNDGITETLDRRKKEASMSERAEIRTMFEFIDADEGRTPPDAKNFDEKNA